MVVEDILQPQPQRLIAHAQTIRDGATRMRLVKRLTKLRMGNLGDVATVGEGVFEMREHFGRADIAKAIPLSKALED